MLTNRQEVKALLLKWLEAKDTKYESLVVEEDYIEEESEHKTEYPLYVDDSMGGGCAAYWNDEEGLMVNTDDDFVEVTSEEVLMSMSPFGIEE